MTELAMMACEKFGERAEIGIGGGAGLLEHQRLRASGRKRKFAPRRSSEDYNYHYPSRDLSHQAVSFKNFAH
jgi:hypothetical protein